MDLKLLNNDYSNLLKKAVGVYDEQHKAIAQNVAKSNVENYKRINTDFSEQLRSAVNNSGVRVSRQKHMSHSNWDTAQPESNNSDGDGRVDVAREMTDLSVNQIRHELVTRALSRYYAGITTAITGRNR